MTHRNTAWLGRVIGIALLIALGQAFTGEISRVVVMTVAGVFLIETLVDSHRIADGRMRSLIRMLLGELALLHTWLTLNIVRVYTYESAVEGPDSAGRTTYWSVVSIQPYLLWAAFAVLIGFVALYTWRALRTKRPEGLNENNV